ncbi:zinc finger protein 282-like [Bufo bufo]|uniref:zinc finger protein 282-like n=1 Tax=Bufo bufo TaxID=8384 RepID=UPI001ABE167D|nr:zinc finger protein 282-like [Bufo bufo]
MMELWTGEVPVRCQDVAVYFSMEEWEYIEGHKDLYKEAMMEAPRPLTSPDALRERNPPERCSRPLYSQDCPEEKLPENHQDENLIVIKVEVMEEAEVKTDLWGDHQYELIERNPPDRCPRPLYSQDCPEEKLPENHQDENLMDIKVEVKEEEEMDLWGDHQYGLIERNPPKRCPRPLYSQDCPEEKLPENHQDENLIDIKVEVIDDDEEEMDLWGDHQYGIIERNPPERCPRPLYSQDCPEEKLPEKHQDENLIDIKVEVKDDDEEEMDLWGDHQYGIIERNPPKRCPCPLYSQDCPEEKLPENHQMTNQGEDLTDIKVKDEEELMMGDPPLFIGRLERIHPPFLIAFLNIFQ